MSSSKSQHFDKFLPGGHVSGLEQDKTTVSPSKSSSEGAPVSLAAESFLAFLGTPQATTSKTPVKPQGQGAQSVEPKPSIPLPPSVFERDTHFNPIDFAHEWDSLAKKITEYFFKELPKLKSLNPSRREAILKQLNKGSPHSQRTLEEWVEGGIAENLSQRDHSRLMDYFEQLARINMTEALLLKRWHELQGQEHLFSLEKLDKLNYELARKLKSSVAPLSEGWHLTRPSLYSWIKFDDQSANALFCLLTKYETRLLGSEHLRNLLNLQRLSGHSREQFFGLEEILARSTLQFLKASSPLKTKKSYFFSASLRDGSWLPKTQDESEFFGFEEELYLLLAAEMKVLWDGPCAQIPLWAHGFGFDALRTDQLTWTPQIHQSTTVQKLRELESCEGAILWEEAFEKSQRQKGLLAPFESLLKTSSIRCSIGVLQALLSLSKLRPKAYLVWFRSQSLTPSEGQEALAQLIHKGNLILELEIKVNDSEESAHSPLGERSLFAYIFQREFESEIRLSHRPQRGILHIKSRQAGEKALSSILSEIPQNPSAANLKEHLQKAFSEQKDSLDESTSATLQLWTSPTAQHEWITRWPEHENQTVLRKLDQLQLDAMSLNRVVNVTAHQRGTTRIPSGVFVAHIRAESNPRRVCILRPFENPMDAQNGVLLLHRDPGVLNTICDYLESGLITKWLDQFAERKQDRWVLNDLTAKLIPIPTGLCNALQFSGGIAEGKDRSQWSPFLKTSALKLDRMKERHSLGKIIAADQTVHWKEILEMLSPREKIPFTQHPEIEIQGAGIPAQTPIIKMDRTRGTIAGVQFFTEAGHMLRLTSKNGALIKMLHQLLQPYVCPTWTELVQKVCLPRSLTEAEQLARDLMSLAQRLDEEVESLSKNLHDQIDRLIF